MTKPEKFALKIADTPTAEEESSQVDAMAQIRKAILADQAESAKPGKLHKKPRSRSGVRKLTPDEMTVEIDRINRLNGKGKPALAEGTQADDGDD